MKFLLTTSLILCLYLGGQSLAQDAAPTAIRVTEGPLLGRPGADSMSLWVRTERQGEVTVFYGKEAGKLNLSTSFTTRGPEHDYTGLLTIDNLSPNTRYHYRIADHQLQGSFRTMPRAEDYRNPAGNPEGLFNFRFEFACGNNPKGGGDSVGPTLPIFDTLNAKVRDQIHFAILNGDWLYETRRDYPPSEWLHQVGLSADKTPRLVEKAPTIVGVWQNYKDLLHRGRNLAEWHRHMPTYYTADDHELINDIYGTAETGYVNRRAVFRDIATRAWFDYLAWANPVKHDTPAWFGSADFKKGSDILTDKEADFTRMNLSNMANLHVHWGTPTAGVPDASLDAEPGNPNSAVYDIVKVLGPNKLKVSPAAKASGQASYSIGRRCYGKFTVSNCDFFLLDTRSHRSLHNVDKPDNPEATML
ncbi:MAG TPA: alkaline phosphatase, partial [Verrucomicrobiales bacterium]|nr:alkaline phosphatase [Verrucomicrobiales bacterium]